MIPLPRRPPSIRPESSNSRAERRQFPTLSRSLRLDRQLLRDLAAKVARHPAHLAQRGDAVEAALSLAVRDLPGCLRHREAELAELLEGRPVEVDALARLGLLPRHGGLLLFFLLLRLLGLLGLLLFRFVLGTSPADPQDRPDGPAENARALLLVFGLLGGGRGVRLGRHRP